MLCDIPGRAHPVGPQHPGSPEQVPNPCAGFLGSCPQPRSKLPDVCTLPVLRSSPSRAFRSCSSCWLSGGLSGFLLPAEASRSAAVLLCRLRLLSARSSAWACSAFRESTAVLLCPLLSTEPELFMHPPFGCGPARLSWQPSELLPRSGSALPQGSAAELLVLSSSCSLAKLRDRRSL